MLYFMRVELLSHVCKIDIVCFILPCSCKCGFRFCLCALLSQSHMCWVISTQLTHVCTGTVEYTYIHTYIQIVFLSVTYFQYPDIIYEWLDIMLVKNFLGGPHYWGCSYATSVDVKSLVCGVCDRSSQPVRFTPVLIHAVLWVSLVHRCFAYHGNDITFSFVQ